MSTPLRDIDIARRWVTMNLGSLVTVDVIESYLVKNRLAHRSAVSVCQAIDWIKAESKVETPEQVVFAENPTNGFGDSRPDLAEQVRQMTMAQFSAERERLGIHTNTMTFLGGNR